jgi:hypothetical protein
MMVGRPFVDEEKNKDLKTTTTIKVCYIQLFTN